jgi:hypothetical protein
MLALPNQIDIITSIGGITFDDAARLRDLADVSYLETEDG